MKVKPTIRAPSDQISKQRIIDDLKEIGVKEGDHIAVALSLKSIGSASNQLFESLIWIVSITFASFLPFGGASPMYTLSSGS